MASELSIHSLTGKAPDRHAAAGSRVGDRQAWFASHPTIGIIARDRGGGYGEAAAKALPHAVQVADRWHLMENASRAFLDAVRKSMRQVRSVIGATTIKPELLTAAERIQYEGYLRREETNAAILELSKSGMAIKQIARQTGHSRKLVRQVVRGERNDVFRTRQSSLDVHLPWLDEQWASDCRFFFFFFFFGGGKKEDRCASWANGQRADDGPKGPMPKTYNASHRPEQSLAS